MPFIVFLATIALIILGTWMLGRESVVLRLLAILPLLGSFAILLESFSWLNLPEKVTRLILLLVVILWGVALVQHEHDPVGKVAGVVVFIIAIYALLHVLGVSDLWLVDDVFNKTFKILGQMFSWAQDAYEGMK